MRFDYVWAMPDHRTFRIKPIARFIGLHKKPRQLWADPFAGWASPAEVTNDIEPDRPTLYHTDAVEFLGMFDDGTFDGLLIDAPYSQRQLMEMYKVKANGGRLVTQKIRYLTRLNQEAARVVKVGGKILCFGWDANGIGKKNGFRLEGGLVVAHGALHYSTICTAELKVR